MGALCHASLWCYTWCPRRTRRYPKIMAHWGRQRRAGNSRAGASSCSASGSVVVRESAALLVRKLSCVVTIDVVVV